jgi:hypothetical protein
MAKMNIETIVKMVLAAMKGVFTEKWPEVQRIAESETRKFAQNIAEVALWKEAGEITEEEAIALLRLHQRSMKMVLTSLEGISLALAERALNEAIDVIRVLVNKAIGWDVL